MSVFFGFSDECGHYAQNMGTSFKQRHPFYVRSTLIINASEWKTLSTNFNDLKKKYNIPLEEELKWSYLWSLQFLQKKKKPVPEDSNFKFFEKFDYHVLIDFAEEAITLIQQLKFAKVFISVTNNGIVPNIHERSMLYMHIQEIMQRYEMELQHDNNNLGVLFIDPVSQIKNKYFRDIYSELFLNGDFIKEYNHIKDSLNIEFSHHSVGIQIADYIAGTFVAFLKSLSKKGYERGANMFLEKVLPHLRKSSSGIIMGYGIKEVPSNMAFRKYIKENMPS